MSVPALLDNWWLFRCELAARGQRPGTYLLRLLAGVVLLGGGLVWLAGQYATGADVGRDSLQILGRGGQLLRLLLLGQALLLLLLVPAFLAPALTREKEARGLDLLLLTGLSPGRIVLQKLLAGLIPLWELLLIPAPLIVLALALGGTTLAQVVVSYGALVVTAWELGALCLLISAWRATSSSAFFQGYLLGHMLILGPGLLLLLARGFALPVGFDPLLAALCPMAAVLSGGLGAAPWWSLTLLLPALGMGGLFCRWGGLVLARQVATHRPGLGQRAQAAADRALERANRAAGGVRFGSGAGRLPGLNPVAWRESAKTAWGRGRYLTRVLLLTECPVVFLLIGGGLGDGDGGLRLSAAVLLTLLAAAVLLAVHAAALFATERARQSLDLLLVSPLPGAQIVREKFASLRPLMLVLAAPLATLFLAAAFLRPAQAAVPLWLYLLSSGLSLVIFLPLTAWLCLCVGLRHKSPARAITAALSALLVWALGPLLVIYLLYRHLDVGEQDMRLYGLLLSPLAMVSMTEFTLVSWLPGPPWLVVAVNYGCYAALLAGLRAYCLRRADRLLGRV